MNCKKCGAQIRKEDRRADGLCVCPGCGAIYRIRAKPGHEPDVGSSGGAGTYGALHCSDNTDAAKTGATSGEAKPGQPYSRKAARMARTQAAGGAGESASAENAQPHSLSQKANVRQPGAQASKKAGATRAPGKKNAPGSKRRKKQTPLQRLMRRVNWKRVGLAAGCVAVLVVALVLIIPKDGHEDRKAVSAQEVTSVAASASLTPGPTPEPTPTPVPTASVHFRAVGDVMSHKLQLRNAYRSDGSFDYGPQFEYVRDALSKADYTIANLELSIATGDNYSSFPFFRAPEAILSTLNDCGVDFLTMSNNHILDGFFEGLVHTVDKVEEYGFDHIGAYRTAQEAQQSVVIDINGIRFGFLAYTLDVNENDKRIDAEQARFCVKRLADADFRADVQELRAQGAEVVICLPHWGEEGRRSVPASCKNYAQKMVNAGVDIILGSHPHVVLPINCGELEVNGEKKDVLIAWSMGNFISYMATQYMDSGIIVDFTVERDETGRIHIVQPGYVPVYVWGHSDVFHLLCSGDFYSQRPQGMSDDDYSRMKQSVKEIVGMIGQDGIELLTD